MMFWLSAFVLTAAVVLGGGSRSGFVGDVVVQMLAIILLMAWLWLWLGTNPSFHSLRRSPERPLLLAFALFAVMLAIQLVPLPPSLSTRWLVSQGLSVDAVGVLDLDVWRPLVLSPELSWAAAVSVLGPFALFAAFSELNAAERLRIAALIIGLSAVSLILGFLQVAQGLQSSLRFFEFTNPTEAVGFFANRNHFAAQLYTALVFAAIWFALTASEFSRRRALDSRILLSFAAATVLLIAILAGLALARSRSGLVLAIAAMGGIMLIFYSRSARQTQSSTARMVGRLTVAALCAGVLFAAQFGLHRVMTRSASDPLSDLRVALTPATLRAAVESLPFGTGLASFVRVYSTNEATDDLFSGYANRAHNDWAELFLETGVFGVAIAILFLWWFAKKSIAIWRAAPDRTDAHLMLQRAATIVIGLLLAHSLVDYPLRTTAMAAIFAFACALLVTPPATVATEPERQRRSSRSRAVDGSLGTRSAPA